MSNLAATQACDQCGRDDNSVIPVLADGVCNGCGRNHDSTIPIEGTQWCDVCHEFCPALECDRYDDGRNICKICAKSVFPDQDGVHDPDETIKKCEKCFERKSHCQDVNGKTLCNECLSKQDQQKV